VGQQITEERCICNLNSFIYHYFKKFLWDSTMEMGKIM